MRCSKPGLVIWAGAIALTPHAAPGPLGAQLAGHLNHAAHRHAVGEVAPPEGVDAAERGHVDDAAPAGTQHTAAALLAGEELPDQHPPEGPLKLLDRDLLRVPQPVGAGDVRQDIDAAELTVHPGEEGPELVEIVNVAGD
jgi:hypothetical protein